MRGVRITDLEILRVPPSWVWLRVHTDAGITGLGEPYLEGHPDAVIAEVERLGRTLVGRDPRRIEENWRVMYEAGTGYRGGPVTMSAISGVDIALWDILGKDVGRPIHQLLGGACRERVLVYRSVAGQAPYTVEPGLPYDAGGSHSPGAVPTPETWSQSARVLTEKWGFRALKAHVGGTANAGGITGVDSVVEVFGALRATLGAEFPLAIDIHNPHPSVARALIEGLVPLRPLFVEEPAPIERIDLLRQIGHDARVPLAAGERWMGKWDFAAALQTNSLAVVQPDICHAGGITECRKIAALAEAAMASVALHCPLSPLAFAASVQLDATIPNFLVQEHNEVNDTRVDGRTWIGRGYFRAPFVLDGDGCVAVPEGPGLGVEIDPIGFSRVMERPWRRARG